ncbi:hypothetical protein Tco_1571484 [Tanacetum coccineum]
MKEIFEQMEAEVDQNVVDKQCAEIVRKNLLIKNENLIVDCLSKDLLYSVMNSVNTVSRFFEMHDAYTAEQARNLDLEADISNLKHKIQKDDHRKGDYRRYPRTHSKLMVFTIPNTAYPSSAIRHQQIRRIDQLDTTYRPFHSEHRINFYSVNGASVLPNNTVRFEIIKYSFNADEEYIAIKESEYRNHSKDSLNAYRELLRIIDEGWVVATPNEECVSLNFIKSNKNVIGLISRN